MAASLRSIDAFAGIYIDGKNAGDIGNRGGGTELTNREHSEIPVTDSVTSPDGGNTITHRECSEYCVTSCGNRNSDGSKTLAQPDYTRLSESGIKDHFENVCLPAAFFLHALDTVRSCQASDFEATCKRFVPHWRKRLHPDALAIVGQEIKARLQEIGTKK